MRLFFSVGEPSGDLHGANLIRSLSSRHPDWRYVGYGGPKMAEAGCQLHADLTELAVMWVLRVILKLPTFLGLLRRADRFFVEQRPDAVVLIDYPGFNWWIARRAKAHGIPVVYYGTPQLWAWASHRVAKMRRYVDHVLCKLPFEERWFRQRGCRATYVGHPYFDELARQRIDREFVDRIAAGGPLVTILPGSRNQEVEQNGPGLIRAAQRISHDVPTVRFAVAAFSPAQAERIREMADDAQIALEIYVQRTAELIRAADCCIACSGSVSLELLYHAKPSVIQYRVGRAAFALQSLFRKVRYITLVNLLTADDPFTRFPAGVYDPNDARDAHVLMPEYLSCRDVSFQVARHCIDWLTDEAARKRTERSLRRLCEQVGAGGASERAADYVTGVLSGGDRAEFDQAVAASPSEAA